VPAEGEVGLHALLERDQAGLLEASANCPA
jgi:hypothetical protein